MNITSGVAQGILRKPCEKFHRHPKGTGQPRFTAVPVEPPPPETKKPAGKSRMRQLLNGILWLAPMLSLLGGASLVASAVIPAGKPPQTETAPAQPGGVSATDTPVVVDANAYNRDMQKLKEALAQLGWTCASISMFAGCYNGLSFGYASKQPSMVLSSLGMLGIAPVLVVNPSIAARAAIGFFVSFWLAGFANKNRNEYNLKPGDTPREFDMRALVNRRELQKRLAAGQDPTALKLAAAWIKEAGGMAKFMVADAAIVARDVGQLAGHKLKHPGTLKTDAQKGWHVLKQLFKTDKNAQAEMPKPSHLPNQIGSMLLFAGNLPLLFLSGSIPAVTEACMKISALGSLTSNMTLAMIALHQKDRKLLVGIPLVVLGSAWGHTDAGAGINRIGGATISNFYRQEVKKLQQKQAAAESEVNKTPPKP